jgi:putative SOS response-associated peptidase YedK
MAAHLYNHYRRTDEIVTDLHERTPIILPEEHHAEWLGETEGGDLKALLKPESPGTVCCYR